ncbi:uncharacterized protein LOC107468759 [Arachis duranensis]|uniref:Uncharacterized protein LOC107468759 n=1 Tax=Arachis duranensis TaxID=130453 RepID=A0A9C6TMM6_ARADU|nr:uncharacterized protein LOC107468759 [Arachis duranensis]
MWHADVDGCTTCHNVIRPRPPPLNQQAKHKPTHTQQRKETERKGRRGIRRERRKKGETEAGEGEKRGSCDPQRKEEGDRRCSYATATASCCQRRHRPARATTAPFVTIAGKPRTEEESRARSRRRRHRWSPRRCRCRRRRGLPVVVPHHCRAAVDADLTRGEEGNATRTGWKGRKPPASLPSSHLCRCCRQKPPLKLLFSWSLFIASCRRWSHHWSYFHSVQLFFLITIGSSSVCCMLLLSCCDCCESDQRPRFRLLLVLS